MDIEKIIKYEQNFKGLWGRMDDDLKLYYLDKFTLLDTKGKPIANSDSITLNDPRTFADRAIAILGTANRYYNATGVDPSKQVKLEDFYRKLFVVNDEVLSAEGIEPLKFSCDYLSSLRGWIGNLVLMLNDGDKWLPQVTPVDPRWCSYERDRKGTIWASLMSRITASQAERDYGYDSPAGKDALLRTVWDRETYRHYVVENVDRPEGVISVKHKDSPSEIVKHNLDCCPVTILPIPTQPYIVASADTDSLKRQGESVYAANRDIYIKLNELASVWATLNKMQFLSPLVFVSEHGRKVETYPGGIGMVVSVEGGEQFVELPTKELSASAQNLFGQLMAQRQRGSIADIDYGHVQFELSALAIAELTEGRDQVFIPRLTGESNLYRRDCYMIRQQILKGGYKTEIDDNENYIEIDPDLFKEKFQISVEFHAVSPQQNIANYTVANAAQSTGVSNKTIFRDILRFEDPEGELRQAELENAHKEIPELRLYDYMMAQGTGDINEDEIKETRAAIIKWKLDQIFAQNVPEVGEAGRAASQPSLGIPMPKLGGEKIQQEQARREGIKTAEEGKRARTFKATGE